MSFRLDMFAACLLAGPALADDDALRRAAAESYVKAPAQQRILDDILSIELMVVQITSNNPALPEDQHPEVVRLAVEEFARERPNLEAAMIDAAFHTFTLAELKALDRFYRTPEGQAVMKKQDVYSRSLWHGVSQISKSLQDRVMERVKLELLGGE
ncbi:MAG: DUF2059 domain-containing protein [Pseudomonadota bacterium]